jgi:DMSO/TMAO reductase YedYZ molybdopterin-dependent catalytic subunit
MKKRVSQTFLLLISIAILSSSSLLSVSALDSSGGTSQSGNSTWTLRIDIFGSNGVNNSVIFSLDDIFAMPKTTVYSDLSCYGRLIESGQWGGVSLRDLLAQAGFTDQNANLHFYATDGYTTSLKLSDYNPAEIIIAYELDGTPLPETLRLVIPNANGAAWISMITSITINDPATPVSPIPNPAQITTNPGALQQPTTTPPSATSQPTVKPTPQPTVPATSNQPAQHQDSISSSVQSPNIYPIIIGAIVVAAATVAISYLFVKRKK